MTRRKKEGGPVALPSTDRAVATAMAAGAGYNTSAVTWPVGRRGGRSPNRAEIRDLMSRRRRWLRKHGRVHADLAVMGTVIAACAQSRLSDRCRNPACPRCAHALQRLLVRTVGRFRAGQSDEAWATVSIILPVSEPGGEIDFVAAREQGEALLRAAGVTVGVFGLDLSLNEDRRDSRPEAERFAAHAALHLYGLMPAAGIKAIKAALKRMVPRTDAVPRPVHGKPWDGSPSAIAYAHKPDFQRRQTIERPDEKRGKLVRTTRDRPLTVSQQIEAVRALKRAGLTGRMVLVGLRFELSKTGQLSLIPTT